MSVTYRQPPKPSPRPDPVLPAKPADCQGEVGDLHRRWQSLSQQAGEKQRYLDLLRQQRSSLEVVIRSATPESDFPAVAAAEAGVRVLTRFIDLAQPAVLRANDEEREFGLRVGEAYRKAQRLAHALQSTGEWPLGNNQARRPREAVVAELVALIGEV